MRGGSDREWADRRRRWDWAIGVWAVACAGLAIWTALELANLTEVSDTLERSSHALETTASALSALRNVPVVGEDVGRLADQVKQTATSAQASSDSSRRSIRIVAILLPVMILLAATLPTLVAFLAIRSGGARLPTPHEEPTDGSRTDN